MRLLGLFALTLALLSCASTRTSNTLFAYDYVPNPDLKPGATVIIASQNFGKPSRKYLTLYEARIDKLLRNRLEAAGYNVMSSRLFEQPYNDAVGLYGEPYDKYTDKLDSKQLLQIFSATFEQLKTTADIDAVIFTDIVELQMPVSVSNAKGYVEFDGVYRSVKRQGTGDLQAGFDWNQPIDAATLALNIFALDDGSRILSNRGGLDLTQAIDVRKSVFAKSRSMFDDEKYLLEGIELSLHPLIKSERYQQTQ